VEKGADINKRNSNDRTPLFFAFEKGHENLIKYLVRKGADINKEINEKNIFGDTLLIIATKSKKLNLIKYLIEHGADVNLSNKYHSTPLTIARECGEKDIVDYLLQHGAKDNDGDSSLKMTGEHDFTVLKNLYFDLLKMDE